MTVEETARHMLTLHTAKKAIEMAGLHAADHIDCPDAPRPLRDDARCPRFEFWRAVEHELWTITKKGKEGGRQ